MICIIDCGSSFIDDVKKNLTDLGYPYKIISMNKIENFSFNPFSGIIISGSPILLTETGKVKYEKLFKFLKTMNIPVLGIFFGHQITGLVFGSKIYKLSKAVSKKERIRIVKADALFSGIKVVSFFREEHQECITLPKGFDLLAKSGSCDNESMKHKKRNIYGIQFHPEISGKNGKIILKNFLKLCSETRLSK